MANGPGPLVQNDLQPRELPAAVAAPVDLGPGVNRVGSFLSALGQLGGSVSALMGSLQQSTKEADDKAETEARHKALTASPQDLRNEIASGNYFGLPSQRAHIALQVADASNRAFDVSSKLDDMERNGQLAGQDPQQLVSDLIKPHADAITDPLARKQFDKIMGPTIQKLRLGVQTANIQQDQETKQATLLQSITSRQDQINRDYPNGLDHDGKPVDVGDLQRKAVFDAADYAKNNLLMPPDQIEKVMGRAAQHAAYSGDLKTLEAIGAYDRGGAPLKAKYGPTWDAWTQQATNASDRKRKDAVNDSYDGLAAEAMRADGDPVTYAARVDAARAKDPETFPEAKAQQLKDAYAQKAQSIKVAAAKEQAERQETQERLDYVDKGTRALMLGEGYRMPETSQVLLPDGKTRTYKKADTQPLMYQRAEDMLTDQAQREGWPAQKLAEAKIKLYGQNGDVSPLMQQSFHDLFYGAKAGAPSAADAPQRLQQLEFLRQTDPAQFQNLAKGKEQETWVAAYNAAIQFTGGDPQRAANIANQRVFNPGAAERLRPQEMGEKVDAVLKALAPGWTSAGVAMGPLARAKVADAITTQIAAGVPEDQLVAKAQDALRKSHLIVNGVLVRNSIPGVTTGQVAKEYLEDAARYFKENTPAFKDAPYGLAFADAPEKPGAYAIVRTDTGERVSNKAVTGAQVKDFVLGWRDHEHAVNAAEAAAKPKKYPRQLSPIARETLQRAKDRPEDQREDWSLPKRGDR